MKSIVDMAARQFCALWHFLHVLRMTHLLLAGCGAHVVPMMRRAVTVRGPRRLWWGVQALVAKEDIVSQASAQALQSISQEVSEACASMLLQHAVDDGLGTVRAALRRLDEAVREVCRQRRSHKMLVHSSSGEEEEEEGADDGDKDEEMADVAKEEDEEEEEDIDDDDDEEEEDEVRLTGLNVPTRAASAAQKRAGTMLQFPGAEYHEHSNHGTLQST